MKIPRESFEELVRSHHAAVYRTAHRVLRSDADAADVSQQVFLSVWRSGLAGDLGDAEPRLRWLASRLALTALRAQKRRRHHEEETAKMNPTTHTLHPDAGDLTLVRRSLDTLDPTARAAVVLRFQEGMTLAAIGEVMGCAESTAHARLRGAIESLRSRLRDAGFALVGIDLEHLVAESATPIVVPSFLQTSLLAIPAATGSLLVAKFAAVAVLMLGVGGTALAISRSERVAPPITDAAAVVAVGDRAQPDVVASTPQEPERRAVPSRPGVLPVPMPPQQPEVVKPRYADAPRAHVEGTVSDDSGQPLRGATVLAWCRELSSKAESFEVSGTTDSGGRFALELPITHPDGLDYRLVLKRDDWIGEFSPRDLHLRPLEFRRGQDAAMRRWAVDAPGEWSREFVASDGAGGGIAKTYVQVFRRQIDADGKETLTRECGGETDARGRLALHGDHLGEKLVRVVPWGKPYARVERRLAILTADAGSVEIPLQPDLPVRARVVDARSGAVLRGVQVTVERGSDTLAVGVSDAQGFVELRGIDDEPVSLAGGGGVWSRFRLDDVRPGGREIELRLKRHDDPSAIGLAGCEIHGKVVDAETGEPLAVEFGEVGTWWLSPESTVSLQSLIVDAITPWPCQTCAMSDPPPPSPEFHLEVPQPGRYALILRREDRAVAVAGPFDVKPGAILSGVELRAERGVTIEVVVHDTTGAPVPGAEVWIAGVDNGADAQRHERSEALARAIESGEPAPVGRGSKTGADGKLVLQRIPTGIGIRVHVVGDQRREGASAPFRTTSGELVHREVITIARR